MNPFSAEDLSLFKSKGITPEKVLAQIESFKKGFAFADLVRPATPGDGIEILSEDRITDLIEVFDTGSENRKIVKFVPASGAASRMFKALYEFLSEVTPENQQTVLEKEKGFNSVWNFISNIKQFAFYEDLHASMTSNELDIENAIQQKSYIPVVDYTVNPIGLDYGNLPKGLIKFHLYDDASRVAMEEHLVEAAGYARSGDGTAYIHFTVSVEHLEKFKTKVEEVREKYENLFNIRFDISFSVQKPSTDTVAVDPQNEPFREPDGSILFRPGGHGALIENLGEIAGDLVFIKNIDNVVPDRIKPETTRYKKAIGGLLIKLQEQTFRYLEILANGIPGQPELEKMARFAREELNINLSETFVAKSPAEQATELQTRFDRPIRICGMVRNEGEPGGGPFWVRNSKGITSLQVVESSQIDMNNPEQANHVQSATHFNPVDLVCSLKDYKGNRFDLHRFIDPETGFISKKSKGGKDLKALELPGLWNGAMADWITLFVEVPIITFNPVKTVNDLLRPQHQPG